MIRSIQVIAMMSFVCIPSLAETLAGSALAPVAPTPEVVAERPAPNRVWLAEQKAFLENREARQPNKMWKASLAALFAASALDIHSSLGKRELNPLLKSADRRFSAQGVAIKAMITGGAAAAQWFMMRKNPSAGKYAAVANFGISGVFATAAVNNYGNGKAAPATLK